MREIISAFGGWMEKYKREEWELYILTIMFEHLSGDEQAIKRQITAEVQIFYSRLLTRVQRNPRKKQNTERLPRLIGCPDLPVPKSRKSSMRDVTLNGGLHFHAIVAVPAQSRLEFGLKKHVEDNLRTYVTHPISRIDVRAIEETPNYATQYVLKAIPKRRIAYDDILLLPRTLDEISKGRLSDEPYDFEEVKKKEANWLSFRDVARIPLVPLKPPPRAIMPAVSERLSRGKKVVFQRRAFMRVG